MPAVYVASVVPEDPPYFLDHVRDLHARSRRGAHDLVTTPEEADLVLLGNFSHLPWPGRAFYQHPLREKFMHKLAVYVNSDQPWLAAPGVYVSMPRRSFDHRTQRPWVYLGTPVSRFDDIEPDLLFSFVGNMLNAPVRKRLRSLAGVPDVVVEDTSDFVWYEDSPSRRASLDRFARITARSKFVLCPRGQGTGSYRLQETMAAGRVPVILSDQWVSPPGIDWEAFSVRVPESQVERIPALLRELEDQARVMGQRAAEVHAQHFSDENTFDAVVDLCLEVVGRNVRSPLAQVEWHRVGAARTLSKARVAAGAARRRLYPPRG